MRHSRYPSLVAVVAEKCRRMLTHADVCWRCSRCRESLIIRGRDVRRCTCVLILLYVSSYYYICVLILLCMCPHATTYVSSSHARARAHTHTHTENSSSYLAVTCVDVPHTKNALRAPLLADIGAGRGRGCSPIGVAVVKMSHVRQVVEYYYKCVLILVYMCPRITRYVCSL